MTLDQAMEKHGADKSAKWHGYAETYEKYLEPLRDKPIHLLELGTQFNNSIKGWLDYFPNAHVAGVDIFDAKNFEHPRYVFTQGDQGSIDFWNSFNPFMAPWDVVCDDGPHTVAHQKVMFGCIWPKLPKGAIYILEDLWTWPDPQWNQQADAAMFITQLVWAINRGGKAYHGRPGGVSEPLSAMETSIEFMHFYPGTVILKKA